MTRKFGRLLAVALLALGLVAMVSGGSADAKKKGVGKSVDSSEIEDGTIVCADIAAAVFPNGCPDDDSGAGAPPPAAGALTRISSSLIPNTAATLGTFAGVTLIQSCDVGADQDVTASTDTDNSAIGEDFFDGTNPDGDDDSDFDVGETFELGDDANNDYGQASWHKGISAEGAEFVYTLDEDNGALRCLAGGHVSA